MRSYKYWHVCFLFLAFIIWIKIMGLSGPQFTHWGEQMLLHHCRWAWRCKTGVCVKGLRCKLLFEAFEWGTVLGDRVATVHFPDLRWPLLTILLDWSRTQWFFCGQEGRTRSPHDFYLSHQTGSLCWVPPVWCPLGYQYRSTTVMVPPSGCSPFSIFRQNDSHRAGQISFAFLNPGLCHLYPVFLALTVSSPPSVMCVELSILWHCSNYSHSGLWLDFLIFFFNACSSCN